MKADDFQKWTTESLDQTVGVVIGPENGRVPFEEDPVPRCQSHLSAEEACGQVLESGEAGMAVGHFGGRMDWKKTVAVMSGAVVGIGNPVALLVVETGMGIERFHVPGCRSGGH